MFSSLQTSPGHAGRLMSSPAVRRDGQWWLVSEAGSVRAADADFTRALDDLAVAAAAADRAVAGLRTRLGLPPGEGR